MKTFYTAFVLLPALAAAVLCGGLCPQADAAEPSPSPALQSLPTTCVALGSLRGFGAYRDTGERVPDGSDYTGASDGHAYRTYLKFQLPAFQSPLVGADLVFPPGAVSLWNPNDRLAVREVTVPLERLDPTNGNDVRVFLDLGDGSLFGQVMSATVDGVGRNAEALRIPLSASAMGELNARQGSPMAFGITLARSTGTALTQARFAFEALPKTSLVLNFGDGAPLAEITQPETNTARLVGDSYRLAGVACGQPPLSYQWLHNNLPLEGATNVYYSIPLLAPGNEGEYHLVVTNLLGTTKSPVSKLDLLAMRLLVDLPPLTTAREGSGTTALSVQVESRYLLSYTWYRNGQLAPSQTGATYYIADARASDEATYQVVAQNQFGSVTSAVTRLTVEPQAPQILYYIYSQPAIAGLDFYIGFTAVGHAPLSTQWYRSGKAVPGATNEVLLFHPIHMEEAGTYFAIVSNSVGSITSDTIPVAVAPMVLSTLGEAAWQVGQSQTLGVSVAAARPIYHQWYFNNKPIVGATGATLIFDPVKLSDAGKYFVIVSNAFGVSTSQTTVVSVSHQRPEVLTRFASRDLSSVGSYGPVIVGGDFQLFGSVSGESPLLQWTRDGMDIPHATNLTLVVHGAKLTDAGSYVLTATTAYGIGTSAPMLVQVAEVAPYFWGLPGGTNLVAGNLTVVRNGVWGSRPLSMQWRKDGQTLPGETNEFLTLDSPSVADSGVYELVARNGAGEQTLTNALRVRPSNGLDQWDWSLPQPQGTRLKDIAWGGGRYVAVGLAGNLVTSPSGDDGDWTRVLVPGEIDFQSVAWGQGRFLACGYVWGPWIGVRYPSVGIVMTSTDGINWSSVLVGEVGGFGNIVYENGQFVLASRSARQFVYTSLDGLHWTSQTEFDPALVCLGVASKPGVFLALANDSRVYRSTDAQTWSRVDRAHSGGLVPVYGDGRFVRFASDFSGSLLALTSSDGLSWSAVPGNLNSIPSAVNSSALAVGGGRVVATLSEQGKVITSSDLANWTLVDTGLNRDLHSVRFLNGKFWVVGEAGTIASSPDGIHWKAVPTANVIDYYGLARHDQRIVAVGDSGTILTSEDGLAWTQSNGSGRNLHAVAYGNGLFVAGGRRGTLLTSPDGSSGWTKRDSGTTNYIERILYAEGRWVAVTEGGDITTSPDGITWKSAPTGLVAEGAPPTDHEGIAYGKGTWVVVGGYFAPFPGDGGAARASIFVSANATDWKSVPVAFGVRLRDVAFGRGWFVAVGNDQNVWVSEDAKEWTRAYLTGYGGMSGENLRRVIYADGRFVAVGNNGALWTTSDPTPAGRWTPLFTHTALNLHDIVDTADGRFVAVGNNGMILRSEDARLQFVQQRHSADSVELEFLPGLIDVPVMIEASDDLKTWSLISTNATSPTFVPSQGKQKEFFRLSQP